MKHLTITYDGITLFDADVDECQWSDSAAGVAIKGIIKRPNGGGGGGLLEMLTSGSRQRTQDMIETKRAEAEQDLTDDAVPV